MSNYQYQGCYNDTPNRAIPNYMGNVGSPSQCAQLALQTGNNVYGLQYYGQCWVGNNLQQAQEYGPNYSGCGGELGDSYTNQIYYANPATMCNYQMNALETQCYRDNNPDLWYMTEPSQLQNHWSTVGCYEARNNQCPPFQTSSGNYIFNGCYADTPNRAIPNFRGNVGSVDQCAQIAEQNQEMVFGVQDGGQCFTGSNSSQALEYGYLNSNINQCSAMGGWWTNQVYVRDQPFPPPLPPIPQLSQNNFNT